MGVASTTVRSVVAVLSVAVLSVTTLPAESYNALAFRPRLERPAAEPERHHTEPAISVYAQTEELDAMAIDALSAFADAGLELPGLHMRLYRDREPCLPEDGSHRAGVTIIYPDGYEIISCGSLAVALHELAHVWEHHALDDETRASFLELRGLEEWTSDVWAKSGAEHLASIVSWGLSGVRPTRVRPHDTVALAAAYELATGQTAPTLKEQGLAIVDGRVRRVVTSSPTAIATIDTGTGSGVTVPPR